VSSWIVRPDRLTITVFRCGQHLRFKRLKTFHFFQAPLHLGWREVLVSIVNRLEFAAVDGGQGLTKQIQLDISLQIVRTLYVWLYRCADGNWQSF
jgi:hypothetical protein